MHALLCTSIARCCEGLKQAACQTFAAAILESWHLSETLPQPVAFAAAAAAALAADEGLQAAPQAGAEALPEAPPMQVKPCVGASAAAGQVFGWTQLWDQAFGAHVPGLA